MKTLSTIALAVLISGCSLLHRTPIPGSNIPEIQGELHTLFALEYVDYVVGTGAALAPRQCVFAHYTGWLPDGKQFDTSRDSTNGRPGQPLGFAQGARRVILGWDVGFDGMKVGGKRRLFIPHQLAYGDRGSPPTIPPNAQLIFDVELMAVADTLPRAAPAAGAAAPPAGGRGGAAAGPQCPTWATVAASRR